MALGEVSREAVIAAMDECDRLGQEHFLEKYGFRSARSYVVVRDGRTYDSKAIFGVAYGFDHPDHGALKSEEFSGGRHLVAKRLEELGFTVDHLAHHGEDEFVSYALALLHPSATTYKHAVLL